MSVQRRETKAGTRWDVRLRDPAGRVYTRTFRTRRDAEAYERAELTARQQGMWVDPRLGQRTLAEWVGEWWPAHEPGLAPKTRSQYRSTIRHWLLPPLGERPLASITPLEVQRLVNTWAGDAKPSTVQHRYAVVRTVFVAAVLADRIGRSPCRGIKLPRVQPVRRQLPGTEELTALAEATRPEYRAMVWIGAALGLRWGEVAGLKVGSVDLLRGALAVSETVGEADGRIHTGPPKSAAGRRKLPLPQPLVDVLAAHLAAAGLTAADADRYVFTAPMGGPLRYSWWHEMVWDRARRQIGRPDLGFHDLRRAYATALVAEAVDVKVSQELMGHMDIRMTRGLYAQAGGGDKRRANDAVAGRFFPTADGGATADSANEARVRSGPRE